MNSRCHNPNHKWYRRYGERGITVDPRWRQGNPEGFVNFLADMGERPSKEMTLDRFPDPDGSYTKDNCRWADKTLQRSNRSPTQPVEDDGWVDLGDL